MRQGLNPNKPYISIEVQTKKYGGENQYQIIGQKVVLRKHEQMSIAKIRVNGRIWGLEVCVVVQKRNIPI